MALSLIVGWSISLTGRPMAGNLIGSAVMLGGGLIVYLWAYASACRIAPAEQRSARISTAPLSGRDHAPIAVATTALGFSLIVGLATAAYSLFAYPDIAQRVPALLSPAGADGLVDRSVAAFFFLPGLTLLLPVFPALMSVLTAGAKISLRAGTGGARPRHSELFARPTPCC